MHKLFNRLSNYIYIFPYTNNERFHLQIGMVLEIKEILQKSENGRMYRNAVGVLVLKTAPTPVVEETPTVAKKKVRYFSDYFRLSLF